jgi:hypothetical protein
MLRVIRSLVFVTVLVGVWFAFGGSALADNIPYQGGVVQHAPTFYAVYWLPSGDTFEPAVVNGDQQYEDRMNQFLQDVSSTNLANVVSQYTDASGGVDATRSTFGGSWVDTAAYPPGADGSIDHPLQDSDIQNEVRRALTENPSWETGPDDNGGPDSGVNATVFVFTPKGINMCFHDPSTNGCTPQVNEGVAGCGDHWFIGSPDVPQSIHTLVYAALPEDETLGTDNTLHGCTGTGALPQFDVYADTEISGLAHELFEAETDPTHGAWDAIGGGVTGAEIADKCVGDYGYQPWGPFGTAGYNVDGRLYYIQQMWSNITGDCEGSNPHTGYFQVYGLFAFTAGQPTGALLLAKTGFAPGLVAAPSPTIDWGDGSTDNVRVATTPDCSVGGLCDLTTGGHTYNAPGNYETTLTYHVGCCIPYTAHIWIAVLNKRSQTISFTSSPPSPAVFDGTYTPTATGGGSGNPVTFSIDPSATAVCSTDASGTTVKFTAVGTCTIDANQAGNTDYSPATQVQQTINVQPAPQTISFTSSPPSPAVFGGTYMPTATGGGSGNPVTFSIDPSATAVCSIDSSGTTVTFTGVGTCTIDANQVGNTDYSAATQKQQAFTIVPATLTVTADPQSKQFGAAIPPLTATITGFKLGQTLATSGVTGSPSCSTPAVAASPEGSYQISCTQGTLSAKNYTFTFKPGTLTVTYTTTIASIHSGPLTVAGGQSVLLAPGATVTGPLTVQPGGTLDVESATITGPLRTSGAAAVRACNATLTRPVTITASTGLVLLGDDETPPWMPSDASCAGNQISAPVDITNNTAGVEFNDNNVTAPVRITGNTGTLAPPDSGTVEANNNTISGPVNIQH